MSPYTYSKHSVSPLFALAFPSIHDSNTSKLFIATVSLRNEHTSKPDDNRQDFTEARQPGGTTCARYPLFKQGRLGA